MSLTREAAERVLSQLVISEIEVKSQFPKVTDRAYWRSLCPGMGVIDARFTADIAGGRLSAAEQARALADFAKHGYFQLSALNSPTAVARMLGAVETVRAAGWPIVFTYVYDEFWAIFRTPSLVRLLNRLLGAGYLQTAGIWAYYVDPLAHTSGWPPHVDSLDNGERTSIWIPLSDASIDNGCMYVIPADRVPTELPRSYLNWTSISREELTTLLHNVTPIPAAPGSVLGWNNCLIHWGGRATKSEARPRVSIAAEFLHEKTKPSSSELPVFNTGLPSFPARIRVIGQAILAYEKFEPSMRSYRSLAVRLVEWAKSANVAYE